MPKHLVFYDGSCGLCDRIVQFVLESDKNGNFVFSPLQGETARTMLVDLPPEKKKADSMVLIENYQTEDRKIFILGKAALKTCWLLGGAWKALGIFYYIIPAFLTNFFYKIVAKNRHRFFTKEKCTVTPDKYKDRFLP